MAGCTESCFAILDHSPIGHFILDSDLVIRFWNRCLEEWTGLPREETIGRQITSLFPSFAAPKYRHRIEPIFRGGPPATFSSQLHKHLFPLPLPRGKQRVQQTVVTPLATGEQGLSHALFSIQDVTSLTEAIDQHTVALQRLTREVEERQKEVARRQEAEESLREMDRMKNDFIASTAHELNTPLATILGYAELIQDPAGEFGPEQKAEFLAEIVENAENLSKIIDDLLDISRFEQGRGITLDRCMVVPEEIVQKVVQRFERKRCRHQFKLQFVPGASRAILLDPLRIRQVLENIISNAVKYSAAGTAITVSSSWLADGVELSVSDLGIGMNPAQCAKVFDKFFRADISDTAVSGLGLGMSIVKQIIDEHGGRIDVESALGFGTTVRLFLPAGD